MNSLGFVSPWILAGLSAGALPIIVHFLTRPRPRPIRLPTYHLLLEAGSGQQALHRLRVWALLALRCLAVVALALLFSRPFLRAVGSTAEPGDSRRVVLVVDASLSMRATQGGVSLFGQAQAEAAEVLRSLEQGSGAGVVFVGATPRAALPALSRNLASLHEALINAQPTLELGDPAAALALAGRMLGDSGAVYVFSDFQRTNWGATKLGERKGIACFLRPVTKLAADNVAITSVRLSPAEPTVGEPIEVTCTAFNCTAAPRHETLRLDVPGVAQAEAVSLGPYSSASVNFSCSLPTPGCFPGKVALLPDNLNEDNERFFRIRVRQTLRVLVISDASPTDYGSAAFFISKALCPSEGAARGLMVVRRHSQDTDRNVVETSDTFVIVAPAAVSGEAAAAIGRRVANGAQLICALDGPTSAAAVGALSAASKGSVAPPFRLIRNVRAGSADGDPFSVVQTAYGPLKAFADPAQGDLSGLRFTRHYLTQVLSGRKEEVVAYFRDGSAALSFSPAGRGTAVFANFPMTPDGGNLVGSPLFPALVHELLRALRGMANESTTTPGTVWEIDVPSVSARTAQTRYEVTDPNGRAVQSTVVARGRSVRLALPPVTTAGHYRIHADGDAAGVEAVNVDSRESDTRPVPLTHLVDEAGRGREGSVAVLDDEGELVLAGRVRPLWPWLAGAAAAFLGIEMLLLAIWRRRPRRAPEPRLAGRAG